MARLCVAVGLWLSHDCASPNPGGKSSFGSHGVPRVAWRSAGGVFCFGGFGFLGGGGWRNGMTRSRARRGRFRGVTYVKSPLLFNGPLAGP